MGNANELAQRAQDTVLHSLEPIKFYLLEEEREHKPNRTSKRKEHNQKQKNKTKTNQMLRTAIVFDVRDKK